MWDNPKQDGSDINWEKEKQLSSNPKGQTGVLKQAGDISANDTHGTLV